MKTQLSNPAFAQDVKETLSALFTHTRSKVISAADVWNIQRNKKAVAARRFAF